MQLQYIYNTSCSIVSGEFVKWRFYEEGRQDDAQEKIGHVSWIIEDGEGSFLISWWRERDDEGQAAQDL